MYRRRLCTLQHIVQLVLFEVFQFFPQIILNQRVRISMVRDQAGDLITHLIKIGINGWTRNLLLDLSRKLRLLLDICHSLVNLVNCSGQRKRAHSGGIREETYRFPWMCFRASEAFFIAAIVSWFIFADSSVFTFISSWNFVPCSFSSSFSSIFFRFSAAREAGRHTHRNNAIV
jgi:hypothetical protein